MKPSSGQASLNASINNIISNTPENVKTESDLKAYRGAHVPLYQTAWHGSPYNFDKFTLDHIGEGEGTQVHGYGLYFAGNRETSEKYQHYHDFDVETCRVVLNGKEYFVSDNTGITDSDGKQVPDNTPLYQILNWSAPNKTKSQLMKQFKTLINEGYNQPGFEEDRKLTQEAYKLLSSSVYLSKSAFGDSKLYQVDVPENNVLLDEQAPLYKQPLEVLKGIGKLDYASAHTAKKIADVYDEAVANDQKHGANNGVETIKDYFSDVVYGRESEEPTDERFDKLVKDLHGNEKLAESVVSLGMDSKAVGLPGRSIYTGIAESYGSDKDASIALNKAGVKGITYDGRRDGRCFVVFDDNAISIIEKYNQQRARIQGQTSFLNGKPLISLFEAAEQSTFMHETAHWYLDTMRKLALNPKATRQFTEDFYTLQQWFGNKKLDAEITVEQHEKFARGFEA